MTEENGVIGGEAEYLWVIDRLDGTLNFTRGLPMFSTSIAVVKENEPVVAVVYNPITNSLFTAEKGKGAFWNGEKIQVSEINSVEEAIVSMGRARDSDNKEKTLGIYNKFYPKLKSQRVLGSAALELAWVASGRLEGFVSVGLKKWDCFAGILLITESGGKVTDFVGKNWTSEETHFIASNGRVHDKLIEIISA